MIPAPERIRAFLDHKVCAVCSSPVAPFGFRVRVRSGRFGIWACMAHRHEVQAMREWAEQNPAQFNRRSTAARQPAQERLL